MSEVDDILYKVTNVPAYQMWFIYVRNYLTPWALEISN